MRRRPLTFVAIVLGGLALGSTLHGRDDLPPADDVIRKVIEKAKQDSAKNHDPDYLYTMRNLVEVLDAHGSVKERTEKVYQQVVIDGEPFSKLVEKNGKPLTDEDHKREQEREQKFRQRRAEREQEKKKKDGDDLAFNEELLGKYEIEIVDREDVNGRSALVATFVPKGKNLPAKRKVEVLLNRLAGRVWIDDQDYELVKAQFHLTEPASIFLGILASVKKFDGSFQQTRFEDGTWLPVRFDNYLEGRIVFKSLHQRTQLQWSDFKKVSPEGKKQGAEAR